MKMIRALKNNLKIIEKRQILDEYKKKGGVFMVVVMVNCRNTVQRLVVKMVPKAVALTSQVVPPVPAELLVTKVAPVIVYPPPVAESPVSQVAVDEKGSYNQYFLGPHRNSRELRHSYQVDLVYLVYLVLRHLLVDLVLHQLLVDLVLHQLLVDLVLHRLPGGPCGPAGPCGPGGPCVPVLLSLSL